MQGLQKSYEVGYHATDQGSSALEGFHAKLYGLVERWVLMVVNKHYKPLIELE